MRNPCEIIFENLQYQFLTIIYYYLLLLVLNCAMSPTSSNTCRFGVDITNRDRVEATRASVCEKAVRPKSKNKGWTKTKTKSQCKKSNSDVLKRDYVILKMVRDFNSNAGLTLRKKEKQKFFYVSTYCQSQWRLFARRRFICTSQGTHLHHIIGTLAYFEL